MKNIIMGFLLMAVAPAAWCGSSAFGGSKNDPSQKVKQVCRSDIKSNCKQIKYGSGLLACLDENSDGLAASCKELVESKAGAKIRIAEDCSKDIKKLCATQSASKKTKDVFGKKALSLDQKQEAVTDINVSCITSLKTGVTNESCLAAIAFWEKFNTTASAATVNVNPSNQSSSVNLSNQSNTAGK